MSLQPIPLGAYDPQLNGVLGKRKLLKLIWHLTNRCNLGCTYCYVKVNRFHDDLPTDRMLVIADKINESGIPSVQLTGGEVFMRPDVPAIIDRLSGKIRIGVATNGSMMSPEIASSLASRDAFVSISLDHITHALNVLTRKGSDTNVLIENLRMLVRAGVKTGVSTVVTRYNYRDLPQIAEFVYRQGVSSWKAIVLGKIGLADRVERLRWIGAHLFGRGGGPQDGFWASTNLSTARIRSQSEHHSPPRLLRALRRGRESRDFVSLRICQGHHQTRWSICAVRFN